MPNIMRNTAVVKPYNIARIEGTNDSEINLYGEIVDTRPVDWWTGQPIDGNFIVVSEFLEDIADLESCDNITVHINSVGGSLYGGLSIYNRLKNMSANITTIIDGLAASAGSIIFQAGNTRKVNSASNMMIHGSLGFLYGYYNVKDLKDVVKQLDASTKAVVNALAEASGNPVENVRAWVDKETWYTGAEIVEAGFADEIIENSTPISMSLSADKAFLIANGCALSTRGMKNIPANIPIMPPAAPAQTAEANTVTAEDHTPIDNNSNTGGEQTMAYNTIEELRADNPALVAEIENTARAAGASEERARMRGIDEISNAIANPELVNSAKYGETPLTAETLALRAMQEQARAGVTVLDNLNRDTDNSGAGQVAASPNGGTETVVDSAEDNKARVDEIIANFNKIRGNK